jgi:hypothetical protein
MYIDPGLGKVSRNRGVERQDDRVAAPETIIKLYHKGRNLTPGDKLAPRTWSYPPGVKTRCSPLHSFKHQRVLTPGGEHRGEQKGWTIPLVGQSFSPGNQVHPVGKTEGLRNVIPGPQGWISPLGMNLSPRGEICPLGLKFPTSFPPGVNTIYCLEEWRGEQRI